MSFLQSIHTPADLKGCTVKNLSVLAGEIRTFMQRHQSLKQGHLNASLGVVELTIALHYVFDIPRDSLIWDVGHQSYAHKILTGRHGDFSSMRTYGGISGFPSRSESVYDDFGTGHSSTSISAALGMAIGAQLSGEVKTRHIAVIGDASIASGMALEALNHASDTQANLLIILNDNGTGIDPTIGKLKTHFKQLAEIYDFHYTGIIDGHHLPVLIKNLKHLKNGLQFLHIKTQKGRGNLYKNKLTEKKATLTFQDIFGKTLLELASANQKIVAITPAMITGSGLSAFHQKFPKRTFDVGIAEQHAVTFSAGLATKDFLPFCVVYSTFLQRGYDQILHDVCLQCLPVVFCIDRAGLVGEDGATHHGVFDIAYLRTVPNLWIASVLNGETLRNLLYTVSKINLKNPIAIRYPRGGDIAQSLFTHHPKMISIGKGSVLKTGSDLAVISVGVIGETLQKAIDLLDKTNREKIGHIDLLFIKPLDENLLRAVFQKYSGILVVEEHSLKGGAGSAILEFISENNFQKPVFLHGISDNFVTHGKIETLHKKLRLDAQGLCDLMLEKIKILQK